MSEEILETAQTLLFVNLSLLFCIGMFAFGIRGLSLIRKDPESDKKQTARVMTVSILLVMIAAGVLGHLFSQGVFVILQIEQGLSFLAHGTGLIPVQSLSDAAFYIILSAFTGIYAATGMMYVLGKELSRKTWRSFSLLRGISIRCRAEFLYCRRQPRWVKARALHKRWDRRLW